MLPLVCLVMLSFMACQKETSTTQAQEEIAGMTANKQEKITVCHYDAISGTSKTIQVSQQSLAGHLGHGDLKGDCSQVLVTICDQDWMARNLDVSTYRNGDVIPEVTDPTAWNDLRTGAWCYYENNSANGPIYGKLYNWHAVNDPRGLAPSGWHVPTDDEWTTLSNCLGGDAVAGGKLKSVGTIEAGTGLWYEPNGAAINSTGFTGLPAGWRQSDNTFDLKGYVEIWHSSSEEDVGITAFVRSLYYAHGFFNRGSTGMREGLSVRCLRD